MPLGLGEGDCRLSLLSPSIKCTDRDGELSRVCGRLCCARIESSRLFFGTPSLAVEGRGEFAENVTDGSTRRPRASSAATSELRRNDGRLRPRFAWVAWCVTNGIFDVRLVERAPRLPSAAPGAGGSFGPTPVLPSEAQPSSSSSSSKTSSCDACCASKSGCLPLARALGALVGDTALWAADERCASSRVMLRPTSSAFSCRSFIFPDQVIRGCSVPSGWLLLTTVTSTCRRSVSTLID